MKCYECEKKIKKGQEQRIVSEFCFVKFFCQECFEQYEFQVIGKVGYFKQVV